MDTEVRVFHIYYTHYRYMYIYHRVNDAQIVREFIKKELKNFDSSLTSHIHILQHSRQYQ